MEKEVIIANEYFELIKITHNEPDFQDAMQTFIVNAKDLSNKHSDVECQAHIDSNGKKFITHLFVNIPSLCTREVSELNEQIDALQKTSEFYSKICEYFNNEGFVRYI